MVNGGEIYGGLYAPIDEVVEQIVDYAHSCIQGLNTESGRWLQGTARIKYSKSPSDKKHLITIELEEK